MTSVPLPSHLNGTTAKRESALQKYTYSGDSCETRLPRYHATSTKMNVFQSISSFLRKNKKVPERAEPLQAKRPAERKGSSVAESDDADNSDKRVEEESYEGSELSDDNKDDIAFVRSTFRQSVKRAIGWRKSQRKAVNKRKKENIHNSKLLTGGTKDEDEFYDDTELDVVVITEADGIPDDPQIKRLPAPSSSKGSKIPKRRNSTKRPAVSLKSSGFFSQSVASKRSEGGKTVTARTNKASELREVAIKKKLESTPGQSTTVPAAPPPTARRKPRASFRTKKGISRRPVHKKDIKPAENKASQLRAKKNKEELEDEQRQRSESISKQAESREPDARRSDRFSSVAIKTPAPGTENKDPLTYTQNYRNESVSRIRTNSESNRLRTSTSDTPTTNIPGRVTKSSPQKPIRSKIPSTSSTSSNIPPPSPRHLPTPPTLPLSKSSEDFQARKYSGRSEKTSSSIPKPKLGSPHDPTKELVFIPLDSVSLPLPTNNKIDDMKRKRKIQRPSGVSNIFHGGAGDLPSSNIRRQLSNDDSDTTFTVHVNKTPTKSVPTTPKKTYVSKTPASSSVPNSSSIPSNLSSRLNSSGCIKDRAKPKQVQNLSKFTRKNSIESARRSKKGIPAISRLSESNSFHSESSDPDNSTSYDSCRSADDDEYLISLPGSPQLCESPRLPVPRTPAPKTPVLISTDDLEIQKQKLRTPTKRSGSISVKQVRIRKSWIRPNTDNEILDPEIEKVKVALSEEVLIIEDLISGHQDIIQKLSSRTLVLKNVTSALRRSDMERAARMTVSLCFPRSHPDEEFKSMRRACVCTSDDLALFQNCLTLLLVDREKLTLPVVAILIGKVRFTFEVLGSEVLRGNIGEALKLITGNFGTKIAHRDSTPGINYRLQENAEDCHQELLLVKKHVHKLTAVDYSPELLALKKTLELFDL